mmetsp:Transcript_12598/g.32285  ORF Transcript_12598/g.32285 Transcript_12598/m.32285 type:complete len:396 (+) Transcript_12598:249-1436(+)
MADFAAVVAMGDQKAKVAAYRGILEGYIASGVAEDLKSFVDHMLAEDVPLVVRRQMLNLFAAGIKSLPAETHKEVAQYTLEKIQPRVVSFEDTVTAIREQLAEVLEAGEDWAKAAQVLSGIDLDSGARSADSAYKLGKNVKIAMLYLEDDDPVNAEVFIKKAHFLVASCEDKALELQYKVCYARILDSKRRFLDAATRYYELSQLETLRVAGKMVDEGELEQALAAAITCTILASAGPQRSRVLATLYKDERCARLSVFPFLEKVYLERILRPAEVEAFAQTLSPHQCALLPDGSTVLDRAVTQHNLSAASKLYNNITCAELGTLLRVSAEKAESVAAKMILEERMQGSIDQVAGVIRFDVASEELQHWDQQIMGVCQTVNAIIEDMARKGIKVE